VLHKSPENKKPSRNIQQELLILKSLTALSGKIKIAEFRQLSSGLCKINLRKLGSNFGKRGS
jgi:hypothetical protein